MKLDEALSKVQSLTRRERVLGAISAERNRQIELWGEQRHDPGRWLAILGEEFGEVAKEVVEGLFARCDLSTDPLRAELVQLTAVAVAWLEALDA